MNSLTTVDPFHRQIARDALLRFKAGTISFDELEAEWPPSTDSAVRAISGRLWHVFYNDLRSRQVGRSPLAPAELHVVDRCIDFLGTRLPYRWPLKGSSVMDKFKRAWSDLQTAPQDVNSPHGEPDVWPFFQSSEIETTHPNVEL